MTDTDLVALERARSEAWSALNVLGATNVYGMSSEDRVSVDIEYQRAKNRYFEAEKAYRSALEEAT